ncbi:uncharacterized protein, partial [Halyomorpha halys]|uniref:uncharacterized protein n=1 Tax=Halyomorpha halys TaxID=286706 RepID=UPI0006D4F3E9
MPSFRKAEVSSKYCSLTECLLNLISSTCNDVKASGIKLYINFRKGSFHYICQGMALSRSQMKQIKNSSQTEADSFMGIIEDAYIETLSRIAVHSKKVEIVATNKKRRYAYKVVFENGIRTKIGFIPAENRVSTTIKVLGLNNIPRRSGDIGSHEFVFLKIHLNALVLIHSS